MVSFASLKAACLLAMAASAINSVQALTMNCRHGVLPRKEWRTLSSTEKSDYLAALNQLMSSGFYDTLVSTHLEHNNYIHGWALFLPWHRYFTVYLEQELQRVSGKPITLPYWNWDYDSQAPELAPVWGDDGLSFGKNGDCVNTGAFANRQCKTPNRHCLSRDFSDGNRIGALTSSDVLNGIISSSRNYDAYRRAIEINPHGSVHVNIGGDMAFMYSPNDPIFFLHHAKVDKLWWDWQQAHPNLAHTYGGQQGDFQGRNGGRGRPRTARDSDKLTPYNDVVVGDVFDTEKLCFTYQEMNVDDVMPDLPKTTVPNPVPTGTRTDSGDRDDRDDRNDRDNDNDRNRPDLSVPHHPHLSKIHDFFHGIFNEPPTDPSQLPIGQKPDPNGPKPVDEHVKVTPADSTAPIAPEDRSELIKLRNPRALPPKWATMNGLDIREVRQHEAAVYKTIGALNQINGWVSPAALWNHAHKVAVLAKVESHRFTVTINRGMVAVAATAVRTITDPLQAVADIRARIKFTLKIDRMQGVEYVKEDVVKIIGPSVMPANSISNPYHPRHRSELSQTKSSPGALPSPGGK